MGLLDDLKGSVLKEVLGSVTNSDAKASKATAKPKKQKSAADTIKSDIAQAAAGKLKQYTPDGVDKIIDDVAEAM